jgi:methyltransferase-like protein/SAM-dependent methyltransferase
MSELAATSYDDVPYLSKPFHYTHPDSMATVAMLRGIEPAAVQRCRVLEIGCAGGGNLIPMAEGLPDSQFIGIDLSPRQIEAGQKVIDALSLKNIALRAMSLMDVGEDFGQFDYIVCHGVYSWVPPEVQRTILAICSKNLAPNGVAYVSYNTYPGWHLRQVVREMMLFHVQGIADPHQSVREAVAFLQTLIQSSGDGQTTYGQLLRDEMEILQQTGEHYIFHEHLEAVNEPLYFHQFIGRAAEHGLQYLGEAQVDATAARIMSGPQRQWLASLPDDVIRREQYLDFMSSRKFRWTLLCHEDLNVHHTPSPKALERMSLTAYLRTTTPDAGVSSMEPMTFVTPRKVELTTNNPLVKSAFATLARAKPAAIPFGQLCEDVQRLARGSSEPMSTEDRTNLAAAMLQCYQSGVIELHVHVPESLMQASERPKVTPLARLMAAEEPRVTNRRHRIVEFTPFDVVVVRHLDGTRDRAALLTIVKDAVGFGELQVTGKDGSPPDPAMLDELLEHALTASLDRIVQSSILIA